MALKNLQEILDTTNPVELLRNSHGPETIAGLKDSSGDWSNSERLLEEFPGFGVFSGSEEFLLKNLRAGGVGCISASTNVTAPLARPVYAAWRSPEAERLQEKLTEVRLILQSYPMQASLKQVVAETTGKPGWLRLLPPNRALAEAQARDLMTRLRALPQMAEALRGTPAAA